MDMQGGASLKTDHLTGLLDRPSFIQCMVDAVQGAGPAGAAAIFLDIRHFARINDALGPRFGDELLRRFAHRLSRALPGGSVLGRISGDSFAMLIPDGMRLEEATVESVEFCGRPFLVGGNAVVLSSHLGAARSGGDIATGYDLLQAADIALHASIESGRRAVVYDPSMKTSAQRDYLIERDLRACVLQEQRSLQTGTRSDAFSLMFQPKVAASDGSLRGFEALLRWRTGGGVAVPPTEFIPIAERAGLMDGIGRWVLRAGCAALVGWPAGVPLAVNVAPSQLHNGDWLLAGLAAAMEEFAIDPARLEIEITESSLPSSDEAVLHDLARRGHKIWVDDFGTGHSSLDRLCRLPFHGLKVDRSITDTLSPEGAGAGDRLLGAVASIAGSLGMDTVVEGVQHLWQAARVRDAGIRTIQGYLHAPPLDAAAALHAIRTWTGRGDHSHA